MHPSASASNPVRSGSLPGLASLRSHTGAFAVALLVAAGALAPQARAQYTTGTTNISGSRSTPQYGDANLMDNAGNKGPFGPYGWNYSYTRSFDGTKFTKDIQIKFQFDADTTVNQADYIAQAKANVASIWNNKYAIEDTANNKLFPISVNITTAGPFNQTVQVHKTQDREDMLNWGQNSTAPTMAHEIGHMMGLYDEYIGGAVNQYPNPTLSDDGLMGLGALNANPVMYPRYYQQFLDYMNQLNPTGSFTLVAVPEPNGMLLLLVGATVLVGVRMRFGAAVSGKSAN